MSYDKHFDLENMPVDLRRVLELQKLIESHYQLERKPEYYSNALGITVERMNMLSRIYLKGTVYELVQERLHTEIEKLLIYTTMTVKEIGNLLGCCDPQYLSRCFKKRNGMSPLEYREKYKVHDLQEIMRKFA
jgi:AraC-like DNA-binding protein